MFSCYGGERLWEKYPLKSMIGLLEPKSGKILVDGLDLWAVRGDEQTHILKKYGVLFQGGALWGAMNLLENVFFTPAIVH